MSERSKVTFDKVIDNTQITTTPTPAAGNTTSGFYPIFADGPKGLHVFKGTSGYADAKALFGEPNSTKYGMMYNELLNHLQAGGEGVVQNLGLPVEFMPDVLEANKPADTNATIDFGLYGCSSDSKTNGYDRLQWIQEPNGKLNIYPFVLNNPGSESFITTYDEWVTGIKKLSIVDDNMMCTKKILQLTEMNVLIRGLYGAPNTVSSFILCLYKDENNKVHLESTCKTQVNDTANKLAYPASDVDVKFSTLNDNLSNLILPDDVTEVFNVGNNIGYLHNKQVVPLFIEDITIPGGSLYPEIDIIFEPLTYLDAINGSILDVAVSTVFNVSDMRDYYENTVVVDMPSTYVDAPTLLSDQVGPNGPRLTRMEYFLTESGDIHSRGNGFLTADKIQYGPVEQTSYPLIYEGLFLANILDNGYNAELAPYHAICKQIVGSKLFDTVYFLDDCELNSYFHLYPASVIGQDPITSIKSGIGSYAVEINNTLTIHEMDNPNPIVKTNVARWTRLSSCNMFLDAYNDVNRDVFNYSDIYFLTYMDGTNEMINVNGSITTSDQ